MILGYKGWEDFDPTNRQKKKPEMQLQGMVNRKNGEVLEQLILEACDYYRAQTIADIDKTPEPFKVLSGMKRLSCGAMGFEGVFAKKAQPDFKGTLNGGRSVVFEAKATTTDRIPQNEVNETQTASMRSHNRLGANVFVLVSMNLATFYRVPWDVWEAMKELFGHKYMTKEELAPYEIKFNRGILQILDLQQYISNGLNEGETNEN